MTEFLLELALLFAVVLVGSSVSYLRWKWKRVSDDVSGKTPLDYLWQVLLPLYFVVLFTVVTGGLAGLVQALIATVLSFFGWFMLLDKLVSQERAEAFFGR
ncbi:MAG: hypothetical protein V5A55_00445 [Halovenus sp.]